MRNPVRLSLSPPYLVGGSILAFPPSPIPIVLISVYMTPFSPSNYATCTTSYTSTSSAVGSRSLGAIVFDTSVLNRNRNKGSKATCDESI